ncbi:MAG TPA: cytochrome b N-terminal domain-containing protein, partial [Candidatus Methylomirabilis sp.]|nr:cytochrome b N-terminal domain-containing protein [Candidatus Methylomirabilis sp.]
MGRKKQAERKAALSTAPAPPPGPGDTSAVPQAKDKKPSGFSMLLLHLHPRMVPEEVLTFTRTCGLGGMAVVLLVLLAGTGALLLFAYEPSAERAYGSVLSLRDDSAVGGFVRNIHFWAANSLVLVSVLHLLRVFYTGAFHAPRRLNWIIGLVLLALVLVSNFTGYLLPWDQLAFWAVTIATGMLEYVPLVGPTLETALRGGAEVGPKTLSIFFVLHIAILPILGAILASFHFWLVRKGGGVILPRPPGAGPAPRPSLVPTSPNLVFREMVVALVLIAGVLLIAAVFDAPLLAQANPGMSPNPAKAPWYFMGIQELLVHLHPAFAVLVVPLLAMVLLAFLPYLNYDEVPSGLWFHSARGRHVALVAAGAALVSAPAAILGNEYGLSLPRLFPSLPQALSNGLFPAGVLALLVLGFFGLVRWRFRASRIESVQAVFTLLAVGFVVL